MEISRHQANFPQLLVRSMTGVLLIVASAAKAYEYQIKPISSSAEWTWYVILIIEYELALGILLISGILKRPVQYITVMTFIVYIFFNVFKIFSGDKVCGCFGAIAVNPRWTLLADAAILTSLLRWRHLGPNCPDENRKTKIYLTVAGLVSVNFIFIYTSQYLISHDILNEDSNLNSIQPILVIEPEAWIGKPFPLKNFIDIGNTINAGKWVVVLYNSGCSHCREVIPIYEQTLVKTNSSAHLALIEIPPYSNQYLDSIKTISGIRGRLSDKREWFASMPVEISLDEGIVQAAKENGDGRIRF